MQVKTENTEAQQRMASAKKYMFLKKFYYEELGVPPAYELVVVPNTLLIMITLFSTQFQFLVEYAARRGMREKTEGGS